MLFNEDTVDRADLGELSRARPHVFRVRFPLDVQVEVWSQPWWQGSAELGFGSEAQAGDISLGTINTDHTGSPEMEEIPGAEREASKLSCRRFRTKEDVWESRSGGRLEEEISKMRGAPETKQRNGVRRGIRRKAVSCAARGATENEDGDVAIDRAMRGH